MSTARKPGSNESGIFNNKISQESRLVGVLGVCVLLSSLILTSATPVVRAIEDQPTNFGADTGNGGIGGSVALNIPALPAMPVSLWCNQAEGYLQDALDFSGRANSPLLKRRILVESIRNILTAFQGGEIQLQPLTYSLLGRVIEINQVFPSQLTNPATPTLGEQGDQAAYVLLYHLTRAARRVNTLFDVSSYVPYYDFSRCGTGRRCQSFDYAPFYTSYIQSTKAVLDELLGPAYEDQPSMGSVLSVLGRDDWELRSLARIIEWMVNDMSRDPFRRVTACLQSRLTMVNSRLRSFLEGNAMIPFNSRTMREYVETALQDVQRDLAGFTYTDGQGRCNQSVVPTEARR